MAMYSASNGDVPDGCYVVLRIPLPALAGDGRGELGYWLGCAQWGRGIMKEAVAALLRHARSHPSLRRLIAVLPLVPLP